MEIDIEKFAKDEGKKIAGAIVSKYGEDPVVKHKSSPASFWDGFLDGELSRLKVEKEIYDRSLHEATAFFLKSGGVKFDDKILDVLQSRLRARVEKPKGIEKLTPEELLGNLIKIEVVDALPPSLRVEIS